MAIHMRINGEEITNPLIKAAVIAAAIFSFTVIMLVIVFILLPIIGIVITMSISVIAVIIALNIGFVAVLLLTSLLDRLFGPIELFTDYPKDKKK